MSRTTAESWMKQELQSATVTLLGFIQPHDKVFWQLDRTEILPNDLLLLSDTNEIVRVYEVGPWLKSQDRALYVERGHHGTIPADIFGNPVRSTIIGTAKEN